MHSDPLAPLSTTQDACQMFWIDDYGGLGLRTAEKESLNLWWHLHAQPQQRRPWIVPRSQPTRVHEIGANLRADA